MDVEPAEVPYSYKTVVVTKSRIDKGLLAIPVSLLDLFPRTGGSISLLDESGRWVQKTFTAYDSASRECRIGGMRDFYERYDTRNGEELVLHVYGVGRYQVVPEKLFRQRITDLETDLDRATTETGANAAVAGLTALTNERPEEVAGSEYFRLAAEEPQRRKVMTRDTVSSREHIPASLRVLLARLYEGRCQVSGFSFLKRNGEPYFEVHHIDPLLGNHVKNVLVVSPNVHAQFTYAAVEHTIDEFGWLRGVTFNRAGHPVFQIVDRLPASYNKVVHSV